MAKTCLASKLSLLPSQSASKYKNIKTIPCPTFLTPAPSIPAIRALTSLNVSKNALCGLDKRGRGTYDASGVTALADAIGKHQ